MINMTRLFKLIALYGLKVMGIFVLFEFLNRRSLRILCYHGFSVGSEHHFRPKLFMNPLDFAKRMAWLKKKCFHVITLDSAIDNFTQRALRDKSVVITIDDGFSTVRSCAAPILKSFGFPATVYVTTYFVDKQEPVYSVLMNYVLWRSGIAEISLPQGRFRQGDIPNSWTAKAPERAECTSDVAQRLGVDVAPIIAARTFHLMTHDEVQQLKDYDVDVQLHTHRHRWSLDDLAENERELRDNVKSLEGLTSRPLVHFCYPTGVFNPAHTGWLGSIGVKSAMTMERGVNHFGQSPFQLRRITDGSNVSQIEFEAEFCGVTQFLQAIMRRFQTITSKCFKRSPDSNDVFGGDESAYEQAGTAQTNRKALTSRDQLVRDTLPFDPTDYLIRGSAWFVALRWSIRSIGLFSTIILARLLTPDDFGLITMATLIVGFVEMFTESGQTLALIRHRDPTREHFDTAWTIGIGMSTVGALLVAASAPLAYVLFHDPRAVPLVLLLSLRTFIGGFENNGVTAYRRDFMFGQEFVYLIMCKFLPFVVLLVCAYLLQSYWAFGVGLVVGRALSVVFSYWLHPFRPRLSLSKIHELWNYSWWMLLVSVADQMTNRFEEFVVGRLFGTAAMGLYNVALDIAYAPTDELLLPLNRNLFAVYAKMRHEVTRIAVHYRHVLSATATVSFATGIGVALVARDLVALVLGDQWLATVPLIQCLALGQAVDPILGSIGVVLNVTGAERRSVGLSWTRAALLIPLALLAGEVWGLEGVAWARLSVILLVAPLFIRALCLTIGIRYKQVFEQLWRPALASICMAAAITGLRADFLGLPTAAVELLMRVLTGASVFVAVLVLAWLLAGRPEGIERQLTARAGVWLRRQSTARTASPP